MKKINQTIIGGIITIIFLCLFTGVSNAAGIFVFSIVCTMGIGLLFWIPLFMGIGYVAVGVYKAALNQVTDEKSDSKPTISPDQQALLNYINEAKKAGNTRETIINSLNKAGWKEDDINKAIESY